MNRALHLIAGCAVCAGCADDDGLRDVGQDAMVADASAQFADAAQHQFDSSLDAAAIVDANTIVDAARDSGAATEVDGQVHLAAATCGWPASDAVIDLGHVSALDDLEIAGQRVASHDGSGRWILWDTQTRRPVAQGNSAACAAPPCAPLTMRATLLVVQAGTSLELRDGGDGHVLATLDVGGRYGVAEDGSYVWSATATGISVWSREGAPLFNKAGSYAGASVSASASKLRLAGGAAGANMIESFAIPSGTADAPAAFLGTFSSWSASAGRFVTQTGPTARVYDEPARQIAIVSLPDRATARGGAGDRLWVSNGRSLSVYKIDNPSAPELTQDVLLDTDILFGSQAEAAALTRGVDGPGGKFTLISLTTSPPASQMIELPTGYLSRFAADGRGHWAMSDRHGVIYWNDPLGEPQSLGCGNAAGLDLRDDGLFAISVAAGQILLGRADERSVERALPFRADRVAFASAGRLVAKADSSDSQYLSDRSIRTYDLETGGLLQELASQDNHTEPYILDFVLAGDRLAVTRCLPASGAWPCSYSVMPVAGATSYELPDSSLAYSAAQLVSPPDADRWAVLASAANYTQEGTTNIYDSGTLIGATTGAPIAWLDRARLLVARTRMMGVMRYFDHHEVVDPTGADIARSAVPQLPSTARARVLSGGTRIFADGLYQVATGAKLWPTAGTYVPSAATDARVIYADGAFIKVAQLP